MASSSLDRAPRIGDADLPRFLELLSGSDSVELKLTVPESDQRSAVQVLGMDPIDAQIRQVFFFDTPDLALDRAGLVVRGRRTQRKGDDSVVKLRPVLPEELSVALRRSAGFNVELDALPGGFVCSASFKGRPTTGLVKTVADGQAPVHKLFSKEQRAFFRAHAPDGLELDDLVVLGPILVLKLRLVPERLGRRLVAEVWLYPDDSRILELSTKCPPEEAFRTAAETRACLTQYGIDLSGAQETKTRRALDFFAARAGAAT
ncbi:hypothetical protein [Candidatus Solirubrobacter pratensis]|uniref:hypothetical protein n=1 Tax=Candidatus Solirubrobacter pratensis TaxID=1298857 RepID=UPI0003FD93A4|nr:hypothetical protein [Candidatus Solirubrobacter pratensis]